MRIDSLVDSSSNESFRRLQRLVESSRERRRSQRSVIEGVHLVESYWRSPFGQAAGQGLHSLFVPAFSQDNPEIVSLISQIQADLRESGSTQCRTVSLSPSLFKRVSQVENGPGPLAIIDTPRPGLPGRLSGDSLYLDRVQDPGNAGSILRTAAAAGLGSVLTSPGTAFAWAPKVLRSAMGAHFSLAIHEGLTVDRLTDEWLAGQQICALVAPEQAASGLRLNDADLRAPTLWLAGSEGQGLNKHLLADPRVRRLTIDQVDGVESLNVAAAVAVALFEQRRQRG